MERGDRFGQSPPTHEPHRVERLAILRIARQRIDRHNARMLKLSLDAGFVEESLDQRGLVRSLRAEFLERDLAANLIIAGHPDLPDAAFGVQPRQRVAITA